MGAAQISRPLPQEMSYLIFKTIHLLKTKFLVPNRSLWITESRDAKYRDRVDLSQNSMRSLEIMARLYFVETHKRRVCLNKISKVLAQRNIESELRTPKRIKAANRAREWRRLLQLYKTEPKLSMNSQELKKA